MSRLLRAACWAALALVLTFARPGVAPAAPGEGYAGARTPASQRGGALAARASRVAPLALAGPAAIGPDVSNHQGCAIDWAQVAATRGYAFVKASEGSSFLDRCLWANWAGTAANGILRGAYHFARPRAPIASARIEAARYVAAVRAAGGFAGALPPVLDVEANRGLRPAALRRWIRTWVDTVRVQTGRRRVIIYTGAWFWNRNVGAWAPPGALLWASGYSSAMPAVAGFARVDWWQYTDGIHGLAPRTTPGLGAVDHSVWLGSPSRLRALTRG